MSTILETHGLTMKFRGFRALDGIDLRIEEGTIHAIIGPNGAGKTTLFNLLSGLLRPTGGRIQFLGRDVTGLPSHRLAAASIARSFQITSVFPHLSVLDNVRLALAARTSIGYAFWLSERSLSRFDGAAIAILESVGLGDASGRQVGTLPYGRKRALEIGLALALDPVVLLLDEPTAGLGVEDVPRSWNRSAGWRQSERSSWSSTTWGSSQRCPAGLRSWHAAGCWPKDPTPI